MRLGKLLRALFAALIMALPAAAQDVADIAPREGWVVLPTDKTFDQLVADTRTAAKDNGLAVVTMAGPTGAAARRGIAIPGNRVLGLFNNDFAVRVLRLSTAAMIEAPIRVYVTENANGSATFSYKTPSTVLAPYVEEASDLAAIASELDEVFSGVAAAATR